MVINRDIRLLREQADSFKQQSPKLHMIGEFVSFKVFGEGEVWSITVKKNKQFFRFRYYPKSRAAEGTDTLKLENLEKYKEGEPVHVVYKPRQKKDGIVDLYIDLLLPLTDVSPRTSEFVGVYAGILAPYDSSFFQITVECQNSKTPNLDPYVLKLRCEEDYELEEGKKYKFIVSVENDSLFLEETSKKLIDKWDTEKNTKTWHPILVAQSIVDI